MEFSFLKRIFKPRIPTTFNVKVKKETLLVTGRGGP
jgi:hypothetical protein